MTFELKEEIPHYDTIISDDVSGRLVSLFLREVINKEKIEINEQPVQTYFIAGVSSCYEDDFNKAKVKKIEEFISLKFPSIKKALLVTEFIATGNTLNPIVKNLEKQDISFDIASVSISLEFLDKFLDIDMKQKRFT